MIGISEHRSIGASEHRKSKTSNRCRKLRILPRRRGDAEKSKVKTIPQRTRRKSGVHREEFQFGKFWSRPPFAKNARMGHPAPGFSDHPISRSPAHPIFSAW